MQNIKNTRYKNFRLHNGILCLGVLLIIILGCQKNKLPGVEYLAKFEGQYLKDGELFDLQHEHEIRILENNKNEFIIVSGGQSTGLYKNGVDKVHGTFRVYRALISEIEFNVLHSFGQISIEGNWKKQKGKIKIWGTYNSNLITKYSDAGDVVSGNYPISGSFEVVPK